MSADPVALWLYVLESIMACRRWAIVVAGKTFFPILQYQTPAGVLSLQSSFTQIKNDMTMKNTVRRPRFDREWKEMIGLLPADRRQVVESAIRGYQSEGIMPEGLDGAEMMAFLLIKKIVDRRSRLREARRRKSAAQKPAATVEQPVGAVEKPVENICPKPEVSPEGDVSERKVTCRSGARRSPAREIAEAAKRNEKRRSRQAGVRLIKSRGQ